MKIAFDSVHKNKHSETPVLHHHVDLTENLQN
jgi:hypothetical protein